jgi:hypothetical protein
MLVAAVLMAAGLMGTTNASAVQPCPSAACTDISVVVVDAHGQPVPQYGVTAQRADGYNETQATNNAGRIEFHLPLPPPNGCYQIVGRPDPYYANTFLPYKVCNDATVSLRPLYRINGISGQQKVYLGDTSTTITVPVVVSALSRTYPAPFHGDALPYIFEHHAPLADGEHEHGGETEELGQQYFGAPSVQQIADGVWQYLWRYDVALPAHMPGYYDMDWGRNGSTFSPMMECRMIWFGFGIGSISPARATPLVTTVTVTGRHLGNNPGSLVVRGSGQVTTISGSQIVSWTDSAVRFTVPVGTKNGWVTVVPPSGVPTNAQYLQVQP